MSMSMSVTVTLATGPGGRWPSESVRVLAWSGDRTVPGRVRTPTAVKTFRFGTEKEEDEKILSHSDCDGAEPEPRRSVSFVSGRYYGKRRVHWSS